MISQLLKEEKERITPKEALKNEWLKSIHVSVVPRGSTLLIDRLVKFQSCGKLRKAILAYLASKASDEDLKDEIEFFNIIDENKDGYITKKELKSGLKNYPHIDKDLINSIMKSIDTDRNGALSFNEFLAAVMNESISKDYSKRAKAFKFFDKNDNGFINDKQLKAALAGSEFKHIETQIFTDVIQE